jgi:hypothetical protein
VPKGTERLTDRCTLNRVTVDRRELVVASDVIANVQQLVDRDVRPDLLPALPGEGDGRRFGRLLTAAGQRIKIPSDPWLAPSWTITAFTATRMRSYTLL